MLDADEALIEIDEPLDYISPYKPQILDAAEYQLNRLLCGGRVVRGQFGDHTFGLVAQPIRQRNPVVSPRYFSVTLAQCEFVVELGLDALQFALTQLQITDALDHLSTALRDAVYLAAIESFLGQGFGINPLQIQGVKASELSSKHHRFSLEFHSEEHSNPVTISMSIAIHVDFIPLVVEWLSRQELAGLVPQAVLHTIAISTAFILDEFFVAQSVVESLRHGDVVITDALDGEVIVRVGHKLQQKGRLMDQNVTLDGYLQEFEQALTQNNNDVQISASSSKAITPMTSSFDEARDLFQEIPLLMTFQLFQQEFTIEQLRQLNTGQCLPIKNTSPSEIRVLVNGKLFANGELVQVEEQLGVRILEFISP